MTGLVVGCGDDVTVVSNTRTPQVTGITVTPTALTMRIGDNATLSAAVAGDSGVARTVTWTTSNPSVATVNASTGQVTAVAVGNAVITATTTADPKLAASATVTVTGRGVTSIQVTPSAITLAQRQTAQLGVTVNAESGVARTVSYTSSNTAVATVSSTGLVTAVAPGAATITVCSTIDTSICASVGVTVTAASVIASIAVNPNNVRVLPGEQQAVTVTITPSAGVTPTPATTFTAVSSAPSVATATVSGNSVIITGVAPGTATVTVASTADPAQTATIAVTVAAPTPPVVTIQSITQGGTIFPVNISNVAGQIDVTINVEPGDFVVTRVSLFVDNVEVAAQQISTSLATAMMQAQFSAATAVAPITLSFRTDAFNPTTGVPDFFNGVHTIRAVATARPRTSAPGTPGTPTASNTVQLNFNNSDAFYVTSFTTTPNIPTGVAGPVADARGQTWVGGNANITAVFVNYSGLQIANRTLTFGGTGITLTSNGTGAVAQTIAIQQGDDCYARGALLVTAGNTTLPGHGGAIAAAAHPNNGALAMTPGGAFAVAPPASFSAGETCGYQSPTQDATGLAPQEFPAITGVYTNGNNVTFNTGPIVNSVGGILNGQNLPGFAGNFAFPGCTGRPGCNFFAGVRIDNVNPASADPVTGAYLSVNPWYQITPSMGRNGWVGSTTNFSEFLGAFQDYGVGLASSSSAPSVASARRFKAAAAGTACLTTLGAAAGCVVNAGPDLAESATNLIYQGAAETFDLLGNTNSSGLVTTTSAAGCAIAPGCGGNFASTTNRFGIDLTPPELLTVEYDPNQSPTTVSNAQVFDQTTYNTAAPNRFFRYAVRDNLSGFDGNGVAVLDLNSGLQLNGLSVRHTRHAPGVSTQTSPSCISPSRRAINTANGGPTFSTANAPNGGLGFANEVQDPSTPTAGNRTAGCAWGTVNLAAQLTTGNFQLSETIPIAGFSSSNTFAGTIVTGPSDPAGTPNNVRTQYYVLALIARTNQTSATSSPGYQGEDARLCDSARNCTGATTPKVVAYDPGNNTGGNFAQGNPLLVGISQQPTAVGGTATDPFTFTVSAQDDVEVIDADARLAYGDAANAAAFPGLPGNRFVVHYPFRDTAGDPTISTSPAAGATAVPGEPTVGAGQVPGRQTAFDVAVRAGPYVGLTTVSGGTTTAGSVTTVGTRFDLFISSPVQVVLGIPNFIKGIQQVPAGGNGAGGAPANTTPQRPTSYAVTVTDVWGHVSNLQTEPLFSQTIPSVTACNSASGFGPGNSSFSAANAIGFWGRTSFTPAGSVELQGVQGNRTFTNPFVRVDFFQNVAGEWVLRGSSTTAVTFEDATGTRFVVWASPAGLPEGTYVAVGITSGGCGLMTQQMGGVGGTTFPSTAGPTAGAP